MSGNVLQWCWDWRGPYGIGSQRDPHGAAGPDLAQGILYRIIRGGDWGHHADFCCAAARSYIIPDGSLNQTIVIGFRTVLPLGQ